jgi:DNA polymerase-3 subunit beta
MKVVVKRKDFLGGLQRVSPALPSRTFLPVLKRALTEAQGDALTIIALDGEVALTTQVPGRVMADGGILVEYKAVVEFLRAVKAEEIVLTLEKSKGLTLQGGGAEVTLDGLPVEEFPAVPKVEGPMVEVDNLAGALRRVSFAMAKDGLRPVLHGVCFSYQGDGLKVVAADGYRLAVSWAKTQGSREEGQIIVPFKAVNILSKLSDPIVLCRGEGTVSFKANDRVLTAVPIQGRFPRYENLIPSTEGRALLTTDTEEMRRALKVLRGLKPDRGVVRLQSDAKGLLVKARNDEGNEAQFGWPPRGILRWRSI